MLALSARPFTNSKNYTGYLSKHRVIFKLNVLTRPRKGPLWSRWLLRNLWSVLLPSPRAPENLPCIPKLATNNNAGSKPFNMLHQLTGSGTSCLSIYHLPRSVHYTVHCTCNVHCNDLIVTLQDLCNILNYANDTNLTVPEVKKNAYTFISKMLYWFKVESIKWIPMKVNFNVLYFSETKLTVLNT